jgi:(p)ppGpp synthase/HD superfamily hydrolase
MPLLLASKPAGGDNRKVTMIYRALMFAKAAHKGQNRKYTNEPYIVHPIRVAQAVMLYPIVTEDMIAAAILHDVPEDTEFTIEQIICLFGPEVGNLVDELTNKSKATGKPRAERKLMDRERLSKVSKKAKIIKILDRIDNLNDMYGAETDFKKLYAGESIILAECIGDADQALRAQLIVAANKLNA